MELASSDAMAARDALPVLRGPLFLWRATPFPFLREKRKWGRKTQADEYPQGAGRICNAPSSRTAALGIGPYIRGGEDGRIGSSAPTFQTEKTPLAVRTHSQGRKLRGTTLIRSVCRSSLQPLTELARPAYYKRSPVLIVCGLRRIFCPDPSV